ncbi:MAG: hypothetical protein D6717_08665 [Gammaproteobacteria bacterium]|nr:MAG: hypothetical protein D6717_08665 [Gammaproteobacteria bacterium]
MDEDLYRQTYHEVNQRRCVFEKSILSRRSSCNRAKRFRLADREGVACISPADHERCRLFLDHMRQQARFALGLTGIDGQLPFNKEIKVQTGGLLGLQQLLDGTDTPAVEVRDINELIREAMNLYERLDDIPFQKLMPSIVSFRARERRRER